MKERVRLSERDLRHLAVFRELAEAGGLTAAEARLGMERSTISRHLQVLEARIGGKLCARGPKGFELTELGRKVLRAALTARDAICRAEDELAESINGLAGELLIGIADNTISNPKCRITEVIARFRRLAPAVETHLFIRPPNELAEDIAQRRLEIAIIAIPAPRLRLATIPLFDEEFCLFAEHPESGHLQLAQLSTLGFALAVRHGHWQSEALAADLGLAAFGVGRGLEAVAILVASGRYVGFLPTHLAISLKPRFDLAEVRGAEHLRYVKTFCLVYDARRPFSAAATAFARMARLVHGDYASVPHTGNFLATRTRMRACGIERSVPEAARSAHKGE